MAEDEMAGWHHQLNGHEFFFKYNFHFIVFSEKPIFLQSLRTWILTWALVEDMGQHLQV